MDECPVVFKWNGFHHHVVIRGADWPGFCVHDDLHVSVVVNDGFEVVCHFVGVFQWLGFLCSGIYFDLVLAQGAAIFDIQMEHQDFTPFCWCVQSGADSGIGVVDNTVDITADCVGLQAGIHVDRLSELIVCQFVLQLPVFRFQCRCVLGVNASQKGEKGSEGQQ